MKLFLRRLTSLQLACLLLMSGFVGLVNVQQGNAVSANQWRAGRIMDNSIFRNKDSMNVTAIQNFLNSKVPDCDTNGSKSSEYGGGSRAQYGGSHGAAAPYTCLKDYSENGKRSAQIIWDAAQEFKINPQALLTLLQKEQNLVTDEWPWPIQYRSATGYGCPDNAPCDSQYYGLSNQVRKAARMFQAIIDNDPDWFTPYTTGHQFIKWSPTESCGGTSVTIENNGTSALYNYTPYQPNQAALSNLYGTGNDCSSYGNRNFWRLFYDWFGSTIEYSSFTDLPEAQQRIRTLQHNGKLYVFYYDAFRMALRMAVNDNSGWTFTVLDGEGGSAGRIDAGVGNSIAVTTLGDSIQLFYYDKGRGNLRHGWSDANGWHFENFDGDAGAIGKLDGDMGISPSASVIGGSLQLFYYDKTRGNLRHSWTDQNGAWHFENLDGDRGAISHREADLGAMTTLTNIGNSIQLYYYDMSEGNLRHAWSDASGWHFEYLDGDPGSVSHRESNVGHNVTATNDGNGNLRLFYYDQTWGNLRHAWTDASGWHFENLDGDRGSVGHLDSDVGINPSMTMNGGSVQLYYYDRGRGNLRHAWSDTNGWHFENLDGDRGSVGRREANIGINSDVLMFGSSLQLYYYDRENGNLRHAWTDASGWHFENLGPVVVY